ncbi:hypothetical protein ACFVS2_25950 [Brevibacillus sp. NPDC058079]|uniref:hypothetical protein n=1 Tax=Brevibacillus sp. NPDC058079 TaxID=3346330 RepID=UPI0036F10CB3
MIESLRIMHDWISNLSGIEVCLIIWTFISFLFVGVVAEEKEKKSAEIMFTLPKQVRIYHLILWLFYLPRMIITILLVFIWKFILIPLFKVIVMIGKITIWNRKTE